LRDELDFAAEENERLGDVIAAAQQLMREDAWAFIGWQPTPERREAIDSAFKALEVAVASGTPPEGER
jgi:hypothetical protein